MEWAGGRSERGGKTLLQRKSPVPHCWGIVNMTQARPFVCLLHQESPSLQGAVHKEEHGSRRFRISTIRLVL